MDHGEEEDPKEYRWETGYEKTWEAIKEDDDGLLDGAIAELIQKAKRKRQQQKTMQNKLGMMRHIVHVRPRFEAYSITVYSKGIDKLLEIFIEEFFDQNPISQMGLIALKSKRAEKITDLTGTAKPHLKALEGLRKINLTGEPSLQNGLDA
ncbi:hypothetical protein DOY81_013352 [Sarcophaga bullata]|nr:hypothetical protein DOY81_013352 [Sarcophaga bullata]